MFEVSINGHQKRGKKMDRNHMLDFLKGIGCIGVVFMHIPFPGLFGDIVHETAQAAVPIFIMISGYYAYGCSEEIIKKRTIRILKIFLFSLFCFTTYNCFKHILEGDLDIWMMQYFTFGSLLKLIIFCTIDFAIPLWYLIAIVETYIVWQFIVKLRKEEKFEKMIPILFVFQILLTTVCETIDLEWFWKTNFISNALPFFALGHYICGLNERKVIQNIKVKLIFSLVLLGYLITMIHIFVKMPIDISCAGIALYSVGLFLLAIKYPNYFQRKAMIYIGKKLSLDVYIFHTLIAGVISVILKQFMNTEGVIYPWFRPILVVCITLVFAFVINKLKESKPLMINASKDVEL